MAKTKYDLAIWYEKGGDKEQYYATPVGCADDWGHFGPVLSSRWEFRGIVPKGVPFTEYKALGGEAVQGFVGGVLLQTKTMAVDDSGESYPSVRGQPYRANAVDKQLIMLVDEVHLLHVRMSDGQLFHGISDTQWSGWDAVGSQCGFAPAVGDAACAVIDDHLHICFLSNGNLWHAIRYSGGASWKKAESVGFPPGEPLVRVLVTEDQDKLYVVCAAASGKLFKTSRPDEHTWTPWVEIPAGGDATRVPLAIAHIHQTK